MRALVAALALVAAACDSAFDADPVTLTAYVADDDPARVSFTLAGADVYPCDNYALGVEAEVRADGLDAVVTGGVAAPTICLTAPGPARWRASLPAALDGYAVRVRRGRDTDTFRLTTSGDRIRVETVEASFVRVEVR